MGELGSEDWDRLESPRVNMLKLGLEAMAAGVPGKELRGMLRSGWKGRGWERSPAGRRLGDKERTGQVRMRAAMVGFDVPVPRGCLCVVVLGV